MKKIFLILILLPSLISAQNKISTFYSDYQLDKTFDGTRKEGYEKVIIILNDPKFQTTKSMQFADLPNGTIKIKIEGVDIVTETIVYLAKTKSKNDIYPITHTETGNDILYVIKEIHKVGKKTYSHTILLGKSDEENFSGLPKYFTAFHCNLKK